MTTPAYLKKGDRIGIVASARKISEEELQEAVAILKTWGLEVVFGNNLFKSEHQFSGTDEERAADLQRMLDDKSIKAVISARGGYGTVRIIDKIDFTEFRKYPKWIIGYSDITVLHSHIHNLGIETLHATMPINFTKNAEATDTLRKALFGEKLSYGVESHPLNRKGDARGELVGGNLSLLYALNGSISDIDTAGKILFIEDLDEYLYHVDRMMINLKRSAKLDKLAGLIVGGMSDMKDNLVPFGKTAEEIIIDAVKEYDYPVCFNFPAGHIDRNLTLIMGREIEMKVIEGTASIDFKY
ncbi:MAG: LD-carboxypeptidase [Bacteroidota bacterium]|jgi:muramoyltetrapeptide carboxypeptidase|nr:LD-carboxypeptidase [Bacteroidota bacterium]